MAFFNNAQAPYAAGPNAASQPLQFFGQPSSGQGYSAYDASGGMSGAGAYGSSSASGNMNMQSRMQMSEGKWWEAFGTGGFEGEPGLMEEIGVNPSHILAKSLTVLNPLKRVDEHIMDDADLAGPLVFCFAFALVLLFSGKPQFSYIYGVAALGTTAIYLLLNVMSETGIDAYRTASVLGYCLLPMVGLGGIGMAVGIDHPLGYVLAILSMLWCTYSASSIFVAVLRMDRQKVLVAYPVGLLYGCFGLLSIFNATK
ncbi:hypothetical protein NliqN6_2026 [Naganishia liquefaciens]|uniref:Protein YIP n=1 Tax=Naganishia liquefaciens TaxID=104408 RepID=A0A8H3TSV4_9TREE|nr:hypothetical protein NliqN6_2026 [Naganishia liquefaciens]